MAIIFVFLGIVGVFVILWNLLNIDDKSDVPKKLPFICIGVLMLVSGFGIPSIGNNTPIGITHYAITTDYYNEIKFSEPVRIEYDIYKYPLCTYNRLNTESTKNIVITVLDNKN